MVMHFRLVISRPRFRGIFFWDAKGRRSASCQDSDALVYVHYIGMLAVIMSDIRNA